MKIEYPEFSLIPKRYTVKFNNKELNDDLDVIYTAFDNGNGGFFTIHRIVTKNLRIEIPYSYTENLQLENWIKLWKILKDNDYYFNTRFKLLDELGEVIEKNPKKEFLQLSKEFLQQLDESGFLEKIEKETLSKLGITAIMINSKRFGI
jgi:hypothetical protein